MHWWSRSLITAMHYSLDCLIHQRNISASMLQSGSSTVCDHTIMLLSLRVNFTGWSTHPLYVVSAGTSCSFRESPSIQHWPCSTSGHHVVMPFSSVINNYRQSVCPNQQNCLVSKLSKLPLLWRVDCLTLLVPLTTLTLLERNWKHFKFQFYYPQELVTSSKQYNRENK